MWNNDEVDSGYLFEIILLGENNNIYNAGTMLYDILVRDNLKYLSLIEFKNELNDILEPVEVLIGNKKQSIK